MKEISLRAKKNDEMNIAGAEFFAKFSRIFQLRFIVASVCILFSTKLNSEVPLKKNSDKLFVFTFVNFHPGTSAIDLRDPCARSPLIESNRHTAAQDCNRGQLQSLGSNMRLHCECVNDYY